MSVADFDIDLRAERELLATHDVARMHERLQTSLRRRIIARTAGIATLLCLALGVALSLVGPRAAAVSPPCPCDTTTTATTPMMNTMTTAEPATTSPVPVPAPERPFLPLSASERGPGGEDLSVKPRSAPSRTSPVPANAVVSPASVAEPAPPDLPTAPVVEGEGSTLKKQLRLYDDAKAALVEEPVRAATLAHDLRARFPDGPLAVEAGLLEVRALLALDRVDDARALLVSLEDDATRRGKRAAWSALRASLPAVTSPDERSRVIE